MWSQTEVGIDLPSLEPNYVNHFTNDQEGSNFTCLQQAILDQEGRLWLRPCGIDQALQSAGLVRFDGTRFQTVDLWQEERLIEMPNIHLRDAQGHFWLLSAGTALYRMNPDREVITRISTPVDACDKLLLKGVAEFDSIIYVLGFCPEGRTKVYAVVENSLEEVLDLLYTKGRWAERPHPLVVHDSALWLMGYLPPIVRFDPKTQKHTLIEEGQFVAPFAVPQDRSRPILPPTIQSDGKESLFLHLDDKYGNHFLSIDTENGRLAPIEQKVPQDWIPHKLFRDESGNLVFLFQTPSGSYQALLRAPSGTWRNYSSIVEGVQGLQAMAGKNFEEQVFLLGDFGLKSVGIREEQNIQRAMPDFRIAAITRSSKDQLLVSTIHNGVFALDDRSRRWEAVPEFACLSSDDPASFRMKEQFIRDEKGATWFCFQDRLIRLDAEGEACRIIPLTKWAKLFAFLDNQTVIIQTGRNQIHFFDLLQEQFLDEYNGLETVFESFIRDIFVDRSGRIWIPTNQGLWCLDPGSGTSRKYDPSDGFQDFRFTSILEDERGRYWIGTYAGGLHIWNPKTSEMLVINQKSGLSNNAVMGIIQDLAGNIWVSTQKGVNWLTPDGNMQGTFFQEDGLSSEEFERFDPYLDVDGKLYFGSVDGISIIDPAGLKENPPKEPPKIFLSALRYYDQKRGAEVLLTKNLSLKKRIKIGPDRRNIQLQVGLSSYLEPQRNRYMYRIEGRNDWTPMGTQAELNLSWLPAGKHTIWIKGADYQNNWCEKPLEVRVQVAKFFYETYWFYATLALLVAAAVWYRLRSVGWENRRLEREVALRTEELEKDKQLIAHQAQELQQLDQLKSRFFTNISHELRTPITLIYGPIEHILYRSGHKLHRSVRKRLTKVLQNAQHLNLLVNEILDLSQIDANKVQVNEVPVAIHSFCKRLFASFESAAQQKKIDYHFQSQIPEQDYFLLDTQHLEKILRNLLSNALKFTEPDGQIRFDVSSESDHLFFRVKDEGRGISQKDLPNVFDRFFQSHDKSFQSAEGSGLGLALSKELAQLMRGDLAVESMLGQGSLFTLRLPAKPTQKPEAEVTAKAVGTASRKSAYFGSKEVPQILIVEDNPDIQELLRQVLGDRFHCILADNGAIAWDWLKNRSEQVADISLIISDIMMPEMDGFSLLKRVKEDEYWKDLPFLMLTARSGEEDKLRGLRMGVDDYLKKPFSPLELSTRISNLLHNHESRMAARKEDIAATPSADEAWMKEVEKFITEAIDKEIKLSVKYLAEKMFLSERQLNRRVKKQSGLTPNALIQEYRLQRARYLLENKRYKSVQEVARVSGFSSAGYMGKVYQKRFGKTPGEELAD